MSDVFTKTKRSEVMSRIRSRGNRDTEIALAQLLRANGITGWRRHVEIRGRAVLPRGPKIRAARQHRPTNNKWTARRSVPTFRVKPDFIFRKSRTAIFVDGCFWHGCPKHATWPAHRAAWWRRKIKGNKKRDALVTRTLRRAGWRVFRVWEHELARLNAKGQKLKCKAKKYSTPHPASGHPLPGRGGEGEARLVRRILEKLRVEG
jgi:DNA mismatch endonuclease (patch repair protein)